MNAHGRERTNASFGKGLLIKQKLVGDSDIFSIFSVEGCLRTTGLRPELIGQAAVLSLSLPSAGRGWSSRSVMQPVSSSFLSFPAYLLRLPVLRHGLPGYLTGFLQGALQLLHDIFYDFDYLAGASFRFSTGFAPQQFHELLLRRFPPVCCPPSFHLLHGTRCTLLPQSYISLYFP